MERFLKLPRAFHFIVGTILAIAFCIRVGSNVYLLLVRCAFIAYWLIYPYAIAATLSLRISKRIDLNLTLFSINWIATFISFMLVQVASFIYEKDEFQVHGPLALLGFYLIYAFIFSFLFPAKIIKTIERGTEVRYGEALGAFALLIIMPINVLTMHKRVLEALKKPVVR